MFQYVIQFFGCFVCWGILIVNSCLQLNPTHENNTQINFLDLCIIRKTNKLEVDICRKPTTTDITINYLSSHPIEHKLAAYRYHINRMLTLPLMKERWTHEWKTIKTLHAITTSPTN